MTMEWKGVMPAITTCFDDALYIDHKYVAEQCNWLIDNGKDFLLEQIQELAEKNENLHAVKESSTDVRRVTAIRALLGDRLALCVGVDDAIVEAIPVGAVGWIAGLVNAFPKESVDLFN